MKSKDFLKKLNDQAKINNEDFGKVIDTFPDVELPDVWVNLFNENFLTRERAEADPKISQKIKAETLNAVDANLKKVYPLLDAKDREEIEKETNTYRKIELLEKAVPNLVAKAKGDNPNIGEELKARDKQIQEFADSIKTYKSEVEENIKKINLSHEQEKLNMKVDWDLHKKISGLVLADEFSDTPKRKEDTINYILHHVKQGNLLRYDDQGVLRVYENKDGAPTLKFINGNDQVTIDSLLSEFSSQFIKRNNAGNDKDKKKDESKRRETQSDFDSASMTLEQRRKAAFAQQNG